MWTRAATWVPHSRPARADASERPAFAPRTGPRSAYLDVIERAKDPFGNWLYLANKVPGVTHATINEINGEYPQVDHLIFFKKFGPATSLAK